MSETPRTDAAYWAETGPSPVARSAPGWADFARDLERELNAAKARIARLEEAGDAMCEDYEMIAMDRIELKRIADWRAAKESKS